MATTPTSPRRRADGERSRQAILEEAARLAIVEGLEGLSIGRLVERGRHEQERLYAHFKSKLELQLATIETADTVFRSEVVDPGAAARRDGPRPRALRRIPSPRRTGASSRAGASSPPSPPR